jgi:hypothetical protein
VVIRVDADPVVQLPALRQLELAADAIGAGDEDRLAITRRVEREQATESAEAGEYLGTARAGDVSADAVDQRLTGVEPAKVIKDIFA